jgi:quercetin 2,3-dioxygenase
MLVRLIAALLLLISSTTSEVNSFQTPKPTLFDSSSLSTTTTTATATTGSETETCSLQMTKLRSVQKILPRPSPHWVGDGFQVYPVFHNLAFTKEVSPLLMFDYGAPKTFPARPPGAKPLGVGQHPHRGFETVTIAFQGEVEHHDNAGNTGVIKAGDVQWMTAGRGIVHQEYHSNEFTNNGGTFEMCQLWVNLPKKDKMTPPAYQEIHGSDIPVVNLPLGATGDEVLGTARVIAGSLGATQGAATTFSPVQVWDVILPPKAVGSEIDLPIPSHHQCMIFVRRGSVQVVSSHNDNKNTDPILKPQEVAILQMNESDTVRVRVLDPDSSILILGGEPIDEPIAARGPFVMNTAQELTQAMMDYQSGNF